MTRMVTSRPDVNGELTLHETGFIANRDLAYHVDTNGVASLDPLGSALTSAIPASEQAIVGTLLEYPQPFYPIGSVRQHVRQGPAFFDLDADGHPDSFRAEFSQVFRGFETLALPNGRAGGQVAHFTNKLI